MVVLTRSVSLPTGRLLCYSRPMREPVRYWLFDLDNTLYPTSTGLFDAIDRRINRYLHRYCDIGQEHADAVRKKYFMKYGLTLVGLMVERDTDPLHYLEYVHRVPVREYLEPNDRLRALLEEIPAPKAIFTNGSRIHSLAVTGALGISHVFDTIFDITDLNYIPKPDPRSYRSVLSSLGLKGPDAVLVEDLERNLPPARDLGMTTILVGNNSREADYSIGVLEEIAGIFPDLSVGS